MEVKVERVGREFGTMPKREPSAYDFENMPIGIGFDDGVSFKTGSYKGNLLVTRISEDKWAYSISEFLSTEMAVWNIVKKAPYAFMHKGEMFVSVEHFGAGTLVSETIDNVTKGIGISSCWLQSQLKK